MSGGGRFMSIGHEAPAQRRGIQLSTKLERDGNQWTVTITGDGDTYHFGSWEDEAEARAVHTYASVYRGDAWLAIQWLHTKGDVSRYDRFLEQALARKAQIKRVTIEVDLDVTGWTEEDVARYVRDKLVLMTRVRLGTERVTVQP